MTEPTLDPAVFAELEAAAGADFARELIATFLEEAPSMLAELRGALAAGNADAFRRAAHSLKSNSQTFGALGLGAMARALELKGLEGTGEGTGDAAAPLDALDQEYARVAAALAMLRDA
jgi:histidine phosphotransfer protein HptB